MPSLFVIGHLKTAGGKARQTVVDALTKVSEYSSAQEPGVLKFCVALPREGDDKSVFAIEEYADKASMDAHMASPAVAELVNVFSSDASLFADSPAIYGLPNGLSPSASFTRSSLFKTSDPFIIFANFRYKVGTTSKAIAGWKDLVENAQKDEEGTLTYTVLADEGNEFIRTVEAYESKDFLESVLVKSKAIGENQKQNGEMRSGEKEVHRLKMVGGYLYKERSKPRL